MAMTDDQLREAIRLVREKTSRPYPPAGDRLLAAFDLLANYAEAQMGRRCEACDHWDECGIDGCGHCAFFDVHTRIDFTCGAFEPKEDTRG